MVYVWIWHLCGIPHWSAIAFVRHHCPCSVQGGQLSVLHWLWNFGWSSCTLNAEVANDGDPSINIFFPIFSAVYLNLNFFSAKMCIPTKAMPTKHITTEHRLHYFEVSAHLTVALLVKLLLFTATLLGQLQPIMKSDRCLSHAVTKKTSIFDSMTQGPGFVSAWLGPCSAAK